MPTPPPNLLSARRPGKSTRLPLSPRMRKLVAVLPLAAAFAIHWGLRAYLEPNVWFLFFPALFASSWLAGMWQGIAMTVACGVGVTYVLVPVEHWPGTRLNNTIPTLLFIATGVVFSVFHGRVKKANATLDATLGERQVFAALVDNSSDFIGIADAKGTPIYVNPAGRRMIGLADDFPVSTLGMVDAYPPEHRGFAADVILRTMLEKGHWHGETYFLNVQTGAEVPVDDTHFLIRDPDSGAVLGMGTVTRDISELKWLEKTLRETSTDLARAQEVAEVGSWRFDPRARELRWSDETYRIYGLPIGRRLDYETFLLCVHPDERAFVDARWQAALRGAPFDIEHRILVGGDVRWVREKAELEFDAQGKPVSGIGIVMHITARRRLEDELRLAEARSSGILSTSPDAIISIDEDQRITMFNEGAERIFGYSRAESLGKPLDMLLPPRLREQHGVDVERFAAGDRGSHSMGERTRKLWGMRKRGEEFPAEASISKLEVGGTPILTVSLRDVTDQRRADAEHRLLAEVGALVSSTLDYEAVLTNLAELIVHELADFCTIDLVDAQGRIKRHNVSCRDPNNAWIAAVLVRVQLDSRLPIDQLQASPSRTVLQSRRPALLEHVTPQQVETLAVNDEHLAALRAMHAHSAVGVPLVAHGTLLGAITLIAARSSRAFRQSDVALVEELARRAALSIDNARLYRASREAIQSRDDILGIVAHDLRNPLNAILLHATMLRQHANDPEKQRGEAIERSVRRMDSLIQDLLDIARMEAGHLSVEQARVATRPMLAEAMDAQRGSSQAARIELCLEVDDDLPDLWADRNRVLQILENLIGNASKFTPAGGTIVVRAARRNSHVMFSVADTGVGIAPEHRPHIFERFWHAPGTHRGGAGLGLQIVKGIVEAHGGQIWFESELGHGATFHFTIPVYPPQQQRAAA
jgi:PAS domain S-box-containing protein